MQEHGYRVIPVNPTYDSILGEKCYKSVRDIPEPVDIVDCFRKSAEIPAIAEDAIAIGAKVLWMQLGVHNADARKRARVRRAGSGGGIAASRSSMAAFRRAGLGRRQHEGNLR
jgi:predicted CoA-binding protein